MKIDVINYTEIQLAQLTEAQLLDVKSAQIKKNRLLRELAEKLQQEKRRLINNGMFLSYIWDWTKAYWTGVFEEEIGWVRDGLLFQLQYTPIDFTDVPYELDFSLSLADRREVVERYYMNAYSTYTERVYELRKDGAAAHYLCEGYKSLLDYFAEMAKQEV